MMNKKKGQTVINLLGMIMGIIIFVLGAPLLYDIIIEKVGDMGSATAFVVKFFIWFIFLVLIAWFIKTINSGEGFFTS